jgi:ribosomal protein S18 acetylase RimI-like enzyme
MAFLSSTSRQRCVLEDLSNLPPLPVWPRLTVRTLPRATAVALFCRLYDHSFGPWPWYQPYTPAEVAATLARARDLLFLHLEEEPIGFAWLQQDSQAGIIEPFGVAPAQQGRGYGRYLLIAALHTLAARGVTAVQIGAWEQNQTALRLYRSLGFRPHAALTYLTRNVNAA